MPLVIFPGQLARKAEFYQQLAQLTSAGLGLPQTFEHLERHPPSGSYRDPIRAINRNLAAGYTLTESVTRLNRWASEFDLALLSAGEQSGRLDNCFLLLSHYYSDRARIARQFLTGLAYPAFVLHFAIFIFPLIGFFTHRNPLLYLLQTLGILVPMYALALLGVYAAQGRHGEKWRSLVETLLDPVPVLGRARHELALSRLASALEALLSAGVDVIDAWVLAGAASGSPDLKRITASWKRPLQSGSTPAELVQASRRFPELFKGQYASGEISGRLDETLGRLRNYYQEEGTRRLRAFATWVPKIIYLMVALIIAYKIVKFYLDYFQMVRDAGGF